MSVRGRLVIVSVLALGCGPSSSGGDGGPGGACEDFDCATIATCSSLGAAQCDELCECFPDRWRDGAFDSFAACMSQCSAADTYSSCYVSTSAEQPAFSNPQYLSNCDAKRSVCPTYPADACDPVNLALLSDDAFAALSSCLGLECGGPAEACVDEALYCDADPP